MFNNQLDSFVTNKNLPPFWCNATPNQVVVIEPPFRGHKFFMIVGQKIIFTQLQIDEMKELYANCHAVCDVAKAFGISHSTAKKTLEKNGVVLGDGRHLHRNTKYAIDETYFEKVDSRDKAYILGLISSDGNIHSTYTHIKLKLCDIELVEAVRVRMNYDRPLYYDNIDTPNHKPNAALVISNAKMYADIQKLGIMKNKSYNNMYPTTLNGFDADFIRGFFDGNGCISLGFYGGKHAADVKIVSTWDLVRGMSEVLNKNGIHTSFGKDKRTDSRIADLRIRRIRDVLRFKEYIYKDLDGQMFLKRKFDKFKDVKIRREGACL